MGGKCGTDCSSRCHEEKSCYQRTPPIESKIVPSTLACLQQKKCYPVATVEHDSFELAAPGDCTPLAAACPRQKVLARSAKLRGIGTCASEGADIKKVV
jgi:hypothetical protein